MFGIVPSADLLTHLFSQSVAPAFLIGAVAGFMSLLSTRFRTVHDRLGKLATAAADEAIEARRLEEIALLKRRGILLNSSMYFALWAAICTTLLLLLSYAAGFLKLQHIFGGSLLFILANGLLAVSLYKFARDVKMELADIHQF